MTFRYWLQRLFHRTPVKRSPADLGIPVSTFSGIIKQVDYLSLGADTKARFDSAFPLFNSSVKFDDTSFQITAYGLLANPGNRLRRFSNPDGLPAGRYFALARTPDGDDGGLLCHELLAYSNPRSGLFVRLYDSRVHKTECAPFRSHLTKIGCSPGQPFLVFSTGNIVGVDPDGTIVLDRNVSNIIPYRLAQASIANTLDLRSPDVQSWFYNTFYNKEVMAQLECQDDLRFYLARHINDFEELLPTLMHFYPGGSFFHVAVGAWLSSANVSALIYPSARANVVCVVRGRAVVDHYGWNMVIYDGSPKRRNMKLFGRQFKWLRAEEIGAVVGIEEDDDNFRLAVSGVEEATDAVYHARALRYALNGPEWSDVELLEEITAPDRIVIRQTFGQSHKKDQ